jgi:hypothetical protein
MDFWPTKLLLLLQFDNKKIRHPASLESPTNQPVRAVGRLQVWVPDLRGYGVLNVTRDENRGKLALNVTGPSMALIVRPLALIVYKSRLFG